MVHDRRVADRWEWVRTALAGLTTSFVAAIFIVAFNLYSDFTATKARTDEALSNIKQQITVLSDDVKQLRDRVYARAP